VTSGRPDPGGQQPPLPRLRKPLYAHISPHSLVCPGGVNVEILRLAVIWHVSRVLYFRAAQSFHEKQNLRVHLTRSGMSVDPATSALPN
jgi:hypothetical protein